MTNEEWLNGLDTEQKAGFLKEVQFCCNTCFQNQFEWYKTHKEICPLNMACATKDGFIKWLKSEHKE